MSAIEELDRVPDEPNDAEVALARQVIGNFEGEIDFGEFEDQYQAELRSIIDAKVAGEEFVVQEEEVPTKVVDLMAALRKSLDSVSAAKKKPARAAGAAAQTTAKPRAQAGIAAPGETPRRPGSSDGAGGLKSAAGKDRPCLTKREEAPVLRNMSRRFNGVGAIGVPITTVWA